MEEKRKSVRTDMESTLVIKRLDPNDKLTGDIVSIDVQDVSKTGVGFICKEVLQIGAVYEANLTIWTKEVLHAFLRIVRIELKDTSFMYGASFVGMPELESKRIEVYQFFNENEK